MITTYKDYYGYDEDYRTLYLAAIDLEDNDLQKQLLSMSCSMSGQEVNKYARIVQNIAIKQNRWDVEQNLRFGGLVY